MRSPHDCDQRRLVIGENCRVEQCSHGTLHVTLGDVTLRMKAPNFLAITTALQVAANRMEPHEAAPATRLLC
jgi:hypothetical protein